MLNSLQINLDHLLSTNFIVKSNSNYSKTFFKHSNIFSCKLKLCKISFWCIVLKMLNHEGSILSYSFKYFIVVGKTLYYTP